MFKALKERKAAKQEQLMQEFKEHKQQVEQKRQQQKEEEMQASRERVNAMYINSLVKKGMDKDTAAQTINNIF
jgi:Skp family chaperone for outer membrane proteins